MLQDPIEFWDKRHIHVNEWASGGDRALSDYRNKAFYLHRLGLLIGLLDDHVDDDELQILDAGCGKGWLTNKLVEIGHNVTGVDSSQAAIDICKKHRSGSFMVGLLSELTCETLFDAVISMDVLFHILDDTVWKGSLENLASLVSSNGVLIIAEDARESRYTLGDYIVHRSMSDYLNVLDPLGYELIEECPYRFSGNPNSFLVFKRDFT